jgi:hypothetical protein
MLKWDLTMGNKQIPIEFELTKMAVSEEQIKYLSLANENRKLRKAVCDNRNALKSIISIVIKMGNLDNNMFYSLAPFIQYNDELCMSWCTSLKLEWVQCALKNGYKFPAIGDNLTLEFIMRVINEPIEPLEKMLILILKNTSIKNPEALIQKITQTNERRQGPLFNYSANQMIQRAPIQRAPIQRGQRPQGSNQSKILQICQTIRFHTHLSS